MRIASLARLSCMWKLDGIFHSFFFFCFFYYFLFGPFFISGNIWHGCPSRSKRHFAQSYFANGGCIGCLILSLVIHWKIFFNLNPFSPPPNRIAYHEWPLAIETKPKRNIRDTHLHAFYVENHWPNANNGLSPAYASHSPRAQRHHIL